LSKCLQVARAHEEHHARAFGYDKSNVTFTKGVIEDLEAAGIAAGSVDVIVSNCVINLSEDKARVLSQAYRALKHGGEMYFSDVYADRRIPGDCAHWPHQLRLPLTIAQRPGAHTPSPTESASAVPCTGTTSSGWPAAQVHHLASAATRIRRLTLARLTPRA
jgi:SAM-dependent methyltransferase